MARHKEFNVEEALSKAMEAFWETGYEATSLADLTHRMGIQKASLYDTFGDKRSLYLSALAHYQHSGYLGASKLLESKSEPECAIRALLSYAIPGGNDCGKSKGCYNVNAIVELAPHDADVALQLRRHSERMRDLVAKTIAKGQANGDFRLDVKPTDAADFVLCHFHGLAVSSKVEPDANKLKLSVEFVIDALRP